MEQTFIMVKPDGVQRNLIGTIVSRFERKGLKLAHAELRTLNRNLAEQHYKEHLEKPFFGELVEFITSGPVFAMVWEGPNAVQIARALIGKTNPADAAAGTIRGDFACDVASNIIHGSDSIESAAREIELFFGQSSKQIAS
jgi:nucleoside-diphosphate kinase